MSQTVWHSASVSFTEKKPKAKKETASDWSDGVLDLLGQLTLQSSSAETQTLLPATSKADETEVIVLDTPRSHKQLWGGKEAPLSRAKSEDAASPSVSAVIDALHLSDIDWNALSFSSSPTPQVVEPKTAEGETRGGIEERAPSRDVQRVDSTSAVELCYIECSLRDRVLKSQTKCNDMVSKHLNYEPTLPGSISRGKHSGRLIDGDISAKESVPNKNQTRSLKEQQTPLLQPHSRIKDKSSGSEKPHNYKFVRTALLSSAAESKNVSLPPKTAKKSVCTSACSSSEDSDTENQPSGPRRQTKTKTIKSGFIAGVPPKPISHQFQTIEANPNTFPKLQRAGPASQSHVEKVVPTENRRQGAGTSKVRLQTPASPVASFDADDPVVCSDSPLPLAERLRLKFLKWTHPVCF